MELERPDLTGIDPDVVAYIEALEATLAGRKAAPRTAEVTPEPEPSEPPTSFNVITLSKAGLIKRTPRHLYTRQRRGGMGVFDIDLPEEDAPLILAVADASETLLVFTHEGRAFRLAVAALLETPVRGRGQLISALLPLQPGERVVALLPADAGAQVALVSERGQARRVRSSFVGQHMIQGMRFHDPKAGGPLAAACWTSGSDEVFIATRQGFAIRFPEQRIHDTGSLGIRLERDDAVVGAAAVREESAVFLLSADGKGTLRQMAGFASNKMPGGGGKVALKTDALVGATAALTGDDLFVISRLCKIVRFPMEEIPPKEGVVQGVNCMALRSDECVATTVARMKKG